MTAKRFIVPLLLVVLMASLVAPLGAGAQKDKDKNKQEKTEQIYIPKEIKTLMQEGQASRQARQDMPVNVFHSLFLPARENCHVIFFLKMKNADLNFTPVGTAPAPAAADTGEKKGPAQEVAQAAQLQASFNVFLQFNRLDNGEQPTIFKEVFVPASIQVEAAGFDPEKEDIYTVGYPLPAGRYLLALAVSSLDMQKISIAYHEFTLPDAASFVQTLETTPVFFVKELEQMEAAETRTFIHKGYFTYSVLKINPNLENVFAAGDNLDVFFFIFGAKPNEQQQYDLEINYEVKKGEEYAIRWEAQISNSPLVSQPLPLKQTVNIKSEAGERTEQRDLPPGNYTLSIKVVDKISGNSLAKTVDFEMK